MARVACAPASAVRCATSERVVYSRWELLKLKESQLKKLAEHLDVVFNFRGYKHGTNKEPSADRENVVNLILSKRRGNRAGDQMDLW